MDWLVFADNFAELLAKRLSYGVSESGNNDEEETLLGLWKHFDKVYCAQVDARMWWDVFADS